MRNGLFVKLASWKLCLAIGWILYTTTSLAFAQYSSNGWPDGASGEATNGFNAWGSGSWLGTSGVRKDWRLGVTGDNTDVGVSVRQVAPNSAAARAGINVGDIIVCVAYTQVGRAGNQVVDLGEQLNRNADAFGRVRLLVMDRRLAQLRSMQVQLDNGKAGLTGNVLIQGGALSSNSIVTIELENATRPYFVVGGGRQSFRVPGYGQSSIPFSLNYDARYIAETDSYRVKATVTNNGVITHVSAQQPFVLTRGYPNTVQLTMIPNSGFATNLPSNVVTAGYPNYVDGIQAVTAAYERYLGRAPSSVELAVWQQMPDMQYRLADLPNQMMGSQEYFDRVGNSNLVWLERVFAEILGRNATQAELDQWMRRFAELGYSRTELLRQLKQASGR
jgi:uncharacterized lipoprotein YbaY